MIKPLLPNMQLRKLYFLSILLYGVLWAYECYMLDAAGPEGLRFGLIREFCLLSVAGLFGILRAQEHPLFDINYLRWLDATPWNADKPFPLRKYDLGEYELAAIIVITLAGIPAVYVTPWHYPAAMIAGHLIISMLILITIQAFRSLYMFGAAAVACGFLWQHPPALLLIVATTYAIMTFRLRAAIERLIWRFDIQPGDEDYIRWRAGDKGRRNVTIPYPFNVLAKNHPTFRFSTRDAILLSALISAGWFLLATHPATENPDSMPVLNFVMIALIPFVRLILFGPIFHRPPISLRGRIATRQYLIPGYDRVFVAPIVAFAVGVALYFGCQWIGIARTIAGPVGLFAASMITLRMRPHYDEWILTGHYRLWIAGAREFFTTKV